MLASHPVMLAHGMEASLSAACAKLNSVGGDPFRSLNAEAGGQRAVEWPVIYYHPLSQLGPVSFSFAKTLTYFKTKRE